MSTSDTKSAQKTALVYLLLALFCAAFGCIYERYSHGVYSNYMIYAFACPLVGGVLPFSLLAYTSRLKYPCAAVRNLYHSGVATLTVGSLLRGVMVIYGTATNLLRVYWAVGAVLLLAAVVAYLVQPVRSNKTTKEV